MKKIWIGSLVVAGALVVGGVVLNKATSTPVEVVHPKKGPVIESIFGLGSVVADHVFQVKTAVPLAVVDLLVKEGDEVDKGSRLLRFDDKVESRAPFHGTITDLRVRVGEIVTPQTPVLTLTDLTNLHIEVSLEQQWVMRLRKGLRVVVTFENLRDKRLEGKVSAFYPRDQQFIVKVELEKFPEGVLPGMTADVAVEVGRKDEALLVPLKAVNAGMVAVRRNGRREKVPVEIGIIDGEWGEVVKGDIQLSDEIQLRR